MEYQKIELKGYKRLQLNNIQLIRMEPKQLIQLILGTNGSGKSSLLREITPLPSPHTQYEKDGYKLLELTHKGHQYQVIQKFDGKRGDYQLIRDGTNIFQGSTATDFRSLIKEEFGITPDIQTLIDGIVKFSTMDVAKRRLWFTMLSHADYTYAFQYYNKLRSRIRDLQGSMAVSQNRYAVEMGKVLSTDEVQRVREQLKTYQDIISRLLESKPRVPMLQSDLEKFLHGKDQLLEQCQKKLLNVRNRIAKVLAINNISRDITLESCQQDLYRLQGSITNHQEARDILMVRVEALLKEADVGAQNISMSLQEIEALQSQQQAELDKLQSHITFDLKGQAPSAFASAFEAVFDSLREIVENVPEEGWGVFTRQTRELAVQRFHQTKELMQQLQTQLSHEQRQVADMDHAKIHHQRECPKCHHQWFHGYDEVRYQALKTAIAQNTERETELSIEMQKITEWLTEIDRVFNVRVTFVQMVRSQPNLSALWERLQQEETGLKPSSTLRILEGIRQELPFILQADVKRSEVERLGNLLLEAQKRSAYDYEQHQKNLHDTEEAVSSIQDRIREEEELARVYELLIQLFKATEEGIQQAEQGLKEREEHLGYLQDSLRVQYINQLIAIFRQEVSTLEQTISRIDLQQSLLASLKKQIEEHDEDIRLLKMAEQAMSPSTGLIAKGLTGFINWFVSRMNQFVKHIWTYPLEVLPMSIQDELELDYKFPIMLDHRIPAADIRNSECNQSTCDIFDLAFRIVAMECLGLKAWPLQLDEFGASFDAKHRNLAFQVVTNLVTVTDIPQIFMVSHFNESYGSLRNVDLTVLHSDNIVLPEGIDINGRTHIS